ncbi:hypothetical protein G7070_09595 [Propioniciclava coleopterorum]|uniref:Lipoprotein n=1 Tax=Propioniciclava coleopterorum TaxID=2714937 RepID=A0A6G7Y6M8_9ACTN|nr:hypothetical protein [Propioniciclava coleopterorum]QIK72472.1 hypothetical protein G7070_09595 [Propioniciclava coleopterorum]
MRAPLAIAALLLLAGCAGAPVTDSPSPTEPAATPAPASPTDRFETAPPIPDQTGSPVALPGDRLEAIRSDLTARGIATDDLIVISARAVTWNDGSWGCPEPGHVYTQALEPGYAVIVEAGGVQYDYRFGSGPNPKLCVPFVQR